MDDVVKGGWDSFSLKGGSRNWSGDQQMAADPVPILSKAVARGGALGQGPGMIQDFEAGDCTSCEMLGR